MKDVEEQRPDKCSLVVWAKSFKLASKNWAELTKFSTALMRACTSSFEETGAEALNWESCFLASTDPIAEDLETNLTHAISQGDYIGLKDI